jgi:hypothetical protein
MRFAYFLQSTARADWLCLSVCLSLNAKHACHEDERRLAFTLIDRKTWTDHTQNTREAEPAALPTPAIPNDACSVVVALGQLLVDLLAQLGPRRKVLLHLGGRERSWWEAEPADKG